VEPIRIGKRNEAAQRAFAVGCGGADQQTRGRLTLGRCRPAVDTFGEARGGARRPRPGVCASDSYSTQAVVSSNLHQIWAVKYGSTMRTDVNYSPSDAFETFPRPDLTERLGDAGQALPDERRAIMLRRDLGLTKLYNLVNEPAVRADKDVDQLRAIHIEVDEATMDAYGWDDIHLDHGFHTYRHVERWTVSPAARVEILDRHPRSSTRQETVSGSNVNAWT